MFWIVAQPQSGELSDVGPHQLHHLGDDDVLVAVVHSRARPVEGAGDELPAVHHCKLVMHADGRPVETHADPCWTAGGGRGGVCHGRSWKITVQMLKGAFVSTVAHQ